MIGLDGTPKRAYSMVSGPYDEYLEFLSIVVEDGPLTSELVKIKVGDTINVGKKAVGTLITDSLTKGKNLWLIGTGTGIAPFVSICRDPKTYVKFENVIVCHTVRTKKELYSKNKTSTLLLQQADKSFGSRRTICRMGA